MTENEDRMEHASGYRMKSTIRVLNWTMPIPGSRPGRIALGSSLVVGGLLGFLPVLGFWMLPLGLLVLAQDIAVIRRWRRKVAVRWHGRKRARKRDR